MKNLSFLFVILLFWSCSTKNGDKIITIDEFPENFSLKGERIHYDSVPKRPLEILLVDSLLIKRNSEISEEFLFYIYNNNNNRFLGSFGTSGRGPNEFISPSFTGQYVINDKSIGIWMQDSNKKKIELINITESLKENRLIIDESIDEPQSYPLVLDPLFFNNGDWIGRAMMGEGRFFYYYQSGDSLKWVEYFPEVEHEVPNHMIFNMYNGPIGIKPDNSRIVSALLLFKRIDVFSPETEHLFSIVFDDSPDNPEFFSDPNDRIPNSLMHYYSDMFLTDNYIYIFNRNLSNDRESIVNTPELHVFTWEGEPVVYYHLDRRFSSFSVDEENGYIYALTPADTEEITSQVFRYELN